MKTKIILITAMIMAASVIYAAETKQTPAKTVTVAAVAWEKGTGHPNPAGHQRNFVDTNKDGVNDRFADANKDGKCDNFMDANNDGYNDTRKHMGRNNTSGTGIGMNCGKSVGKGRHCR